MSKFQHHAILTIDDTRLSRKWDSHARRWSRCRECVLGKRATKHVFGRGRLPADILLVGEAPGEQEDAAGVPFIGRSGKLLDTLLNSIRFGAEIPFTYFISNTVGCAPWTGKSRSKLRAPEPGESRCCSPRLAEVIKLCSPRGVVLLGKVASTSFREYQKYRGPLLDLWHPAYLLRNGGVGCEKYYQTMTLLQDFLEGVICDGEKEIQTRRKKKVHASPTTEAG